MGSQKDIEETTRIILRLTKNEYKPGCHIAPLDRGREQKLFNRIQLLIEGLVTSVKYEMILQETQRIDRVLQNYRKLNRDPDKTGGGNGP